MAWVPAGSPLPASALRSAATEEKLTTGVASTPLSGCCPGCSSSSMRVRCSLAATEGSDSIWDSADLVSIHVPWRPDPPGFGENVGDGVKGLDAGCPGPWPVQPARAQATMTAANRLALRHAAGVFTSRHCTGPRDNDAGADQVSPLVIGLKRAIEDRYWRSILAMAVISLPGRPFPRGACRKAGSTDTAQDRSRQAVCRSRPGQADNRVGGCALGGVRTGPADVRHGAGSCPRRDSCVANPLQCWDKGGSKCEFLFSVATVSADGRPRSTCQTRATTSSSWTTSRAATSTTSSRWAR